LILLEIKSVKSTINNNILTRQTFLYHSRKCWVNFARIGDVESAPQLLFFAYELHQTTLVMAFNSNISPNSFHCNLLVIATSPRCEEFKDAFEEKPFVIPTTFYILSEVWCLKGLSRWNIKKLLQHLLVVSSWSMRHSKTNLFIHVTMAHDTITL
jgi:hypothetical protein